MRLILERGVADGAEFLAQIRRRAPDLDFPPRDGLHLTMLYAGRIDALATEIAGAAGAPGPGDTDEIAARLHEFAAAMIARFHQPVHATVAGLVTFGRRRRRPLVARVAPSRELRGERDALWDGLCDVVVRCAIPDPAGFLHASRTVNAPAGPWVPHITVRRTDDAVHIDFDTPIAVSLTPMRLHI